MRRRKTLTKSYKKKAKKGLKSGTKKIWSCPKGCDLKSGRPCTHLEALISEPNNGEPKFESTHKYAGSQVDNFYYESGAGYIIPEGIKSRSYEFKFRSKLEKAGLAPIVIDIFVLKYIYEMTFTQIHDELGITSITSTIRLHQNALNHLKKVGLK